MNLLGVTRLKCPSCEEHGNILEGKNIFKTVYFII
jgi:hypothetical protein